MHDVGHERVEGTQGISGRVEVQTVDSEQQYSFPPSLQTHWFDGQSVRLYC